MHITNFKSTRKVAFALHAPTIGYCQSLNFIVASLMLFMNEEDCYFVLRAMIEKIFPQNYYNKRLFNMHVDQKVFIHIVRTKLPGVYEAFQEERCDLRVLTMEWFMCSYINVSETHIHW